MKTSRQFAGGVGLRVDVLLAESVLMVAAPVDMLAFTEVLLSSCIASARPRKDESFVR